MVFAVEYCAFGSVALIRVGIKQTAGLKALAALVDQEGAAANIGNLWFEP